VKRRELLTQMAKVARSYGVDFDKDRPVHGGRHDKFFVGGRPIEVPRHSEIVEFTARGILRTFERLCVEAAKEDR
jgi:hypothetical protein